MSEHRETRATTETHAVRARRMITVALPAGAVTFGLFAAMQNFVAVDAFEAPAMTVYEFDPYMAAEIDDPEQPPRPKVDKLDPVAPPPSAPPLVKTVHNPKLPANSYAGTAPADYGDPEPGPILPIRVTSITNRTIQPITPPIPEYPRVAATREIEGFCDVHLSVSTKGDPFNVQAKCSDRVFVKAAEKSVKKVKFAPQIRDGLPVTVTGVVYPLEFRLKQ
ncbi:MAG: energy transducer TonB [Pseudomonadota bacterium]